MGMCLVPVGCKPEEPDFATHVGRIWRAPGDPRLAMVLILSNSKFCDAAVSGTSAVDPRGIHR
jgi:hypothetical protein